MMVLDFQSIAQVAASRGLNTLLEGLALMALSWGVLRVFGARSSITRFAVWFSTLLVIAGLPLLKFRSGATSSNFRAPELTLSGEWASGLFAAWTLIAGALLVRLGFSLWHVGRLRRECVEVESTSYPALMEVVDDFSRAHPVGSRRVKLLVSDNVRVPTALGFFRPAVVLPTWALRDLSADELKGIVLHELAHLRRWDDWTNLAQKFVKALFFFHPAVWWIDSRLALEREIACDDIVLEQTANARTYAASLVSVAEKVAAEKMRIGKALALGQSALGRVRELSLRVGQILDPKRRRSNRGWRPALAIIGTLSVIAIAAMPYAPVLISFQAKTQPVVTQMADMGLSSVRITPASFHWAGESAHRSTVSASPMVVSAKATPHGKNHASKVAMAKATDRRLKVVRTKASDHTPNVLMATASDRSQQMETLTVWRSSRFDAANSTVWTLTVWRIRSADGEQQTLQETIVMNSL